MRGLVIGEKSPDCKIELSAKEGEEDDINPAEPTINQHPKNGFIDTVGQNHGSNGSVAETEFDDIGPNEAEPAFHDNSHDNPPRLKN